MKTYLDKACLDHTPLFITKAHGKDIVVMSKADYDGLLETLYLLKSPVNATRLLQGLNDYNQDLGV